VLTEWTPSVLLVVTILLYISSVIGERWFVAADVDNWGTLGLAFQSLASMFTVSLIYSWPINCMTEW
jgi:hypothetical protein